MLLLGCSVRVGVGVGAAGIKVAAAWAGASVSWRSENGSVEDPESVGAEEDLCEALSASRAKYKRSRKWAASAVAPAFATSQALVVRRCATLARPPHHLALRPVALSPDSASSPQPPLNTLRRPCALRRDQRLLRDPRM